MHRLEGVAGATRQRGNKKNQSSEIRVLFLKCGFLFSPGSHGVAAGLPQQHGLRLETAQLHGGRPRGENPAGGGAPALGLLR